MRREGGKIGRASGCEVSKAEALRGLGGEWGSRATGPWKREAGGVLLPHCGGLRTDCVHSGKAEGRVVLPSSSGPGRWGGGGEQVPGGTGTGEKNSFSRRELSVHPDVGCCLVNREEKKTPGETVKGGVGRKTEGGWSRCSRGRVLGFLTPELGPQGACAGNGKARRLTALVCIAGAEEASTDVWV